MAYTQENGTIWLKPNQSQNPKAPKWKGFGLDDQGRKIDVAIWEGQSQRGPWMRLQVKASGGGAPQQNFQQMRETVDHNVSDVPAGNEPEPQGTIPF